MNFVFDLHNVAPSSGAAPDVRVPAGSLKVEYGPSRDVSLQWATYFDAADAAGISRLYIRIHVSADEFNGRRLGSVCGRDAWALAQRYYEGSA